VGSLWHGIVSALKNVAELGRWIELGPWCVATDEVTWVLTRFDADGGCI